MRSGSPRTTVGSSSAWISARSPARRACRSTARGHDLVEAHVVERRRRAWRRAPARRRRPRARSARRAPPTMSRAQRGAARRRGSRSASSSVWMFARRLAIGVRSSWLASATSWRCASTERSSASSVALKLRASRDELVVAAPTSMRCDRSGSAATASVRLVKRRDRRERRARDAARRAPAASAMPPAPTSASTSRMPRRAASSTSVERRGPPGSRRRPPTPRGEHAQVGAADGHVVESPRPRRVAAIARASGSSGSRDAHSPAAAAPSPLRVTSWT